MPYSFVGIQTLVLATKFNPIFWNTACLIVNSGSLEGEDEKSTDYGKMAKALGDIISKGIKVSLVDINKSNYSFEPDVENNEILFGMKALSNVGAPIISQIIEGRPYENIKDFMYRCPINKTAMISLIKAGAFDKLVTNTNIEPRIFNMIYYLSQVCEPKSKLTLSNFNGLIQRNLVPSSLSTQKDIFLFNKELKKHKIGLYYVFNDNLLAIYNKYFDIESLEVINGYVCIKIKNWEAIYKKQMVIAKEWINKFQKELLQEFNYRLFLETWNKYAHGNLSAWEMESLCFYYHEHELQQVNTRKYGISNFFSLPESPEVDYFFKRNGRQIPIYKTYKIIGTVLCKNDAKSSISLLTTTGVVNVKFTKEYFAMFGRQISEKQEDGSKKIVEKGWFKRGTKVLCTGFRRGDTFQTKSYKHTPTHQLYKILDTSNGNLILTNERYNAGEENPLP